MAIYDEDEPIVARTVKRFLSTIGITSSVDKQKSQKDDSKSTELSTFPEKETQRLAGRVYSGPEYRQATNADAISLATKVVASSSSIIKDLKSMYTLNPELKQISRILVGSIMSPNDMQTDAVNITSDIREFSESTNTKLAEELNHYYNDVFELGPKLTEWIDNAKIRFGAQALMILPRHTVRALYNIDRIEDRRGNGNPIKVPNLTAATEAQLIAQETLTIGLETYSGKATDIKSTKDYELLANSIAFKDAIANCESIDLHRIANEVVSKESRFRNPELVLEEISKYTQGLLSEVSKSNNSIRITTDVTRIRDKKVDLSQEVDKLTAELDKYFITLDVGNRIFVNNDSTEGALNCDRPSIIELPAESVIPVHIPGSPKDHIGYFVMIDINGAPINVNECSSLMTQRTLADLSKEAYFGTSNVIYRSNGFSAGQRYDAASAIFGTTIKKMLEQRLGGYGLSGAQVEQRANFINCLFFNYLQRREVQLVFVPEPLMVYMRYEHREDGTGKSALEDVFFTYALRTTLLVAKSLAAIRNATDKTKISFDATGHTNPMQMIDDLKEMYISKQTTNISVDPQSIIHDIVNKSLFFEPRNIMGLADFKIEVQQLADNHISPDDGLIEQLTNNGISGLGVPHAALNQIGENEYASSVATTNLYYANQIRCDQRKTIVFVNKLIRQLLKYDQVLQSKLFEIIEDNGESAVIEKGEHADDKAPTIDRAYALKLLIDNVAANLPTPNISTNKAHAKEIVEFNEAIKAVLEGLYPDDLLDSSTDPETKSTLTAMKATVKQKLMRDFIEAIGFQGATEIPHIKDLDTTCLMQIAEQVINVHKGLREQAEVLNKKE